MKLLKQYFDIQREIFSYFGYTEDWVVIPLDDLTDEYWMILQDEDGGGLWCYSSQPLTENTIRGGSELYGGSIYTQRFLPKWVYRGEEYTMVSIDTHCDGNKFLAIFDNSKECTDEDLKNLYQETWA